MIDIHVTGSPPPSHNIQHASRHPRREDARNGRHFRSCHQEGEGEWSGGTDFGGCECVVDGD